MTGNEHYEKLVRERKFIEACWLTYQDLVINPGAGPNQTHETRQAFFSGAAVLFSGIMEKLDKDVEPAKRVIEFIDGVQAEIDAFGALGNLATIPTMGTA